MITCLLLVSGAVPALADQVPAGFVAFTEDLQQSGIRNGYMPSDRMMSYHGCSLERDAAYMFARMYQAAEEDGVRLRTVDCYRSYHGQASAYERRCPLTEVEVKIGDAPEGEVWGSRTVRVCSGPPTARPGHSNHSWGRAIDFSDGRGVLSCRDEEFIWLQANAHRFGWVHPPWAQCGSRMEEAWHWEWAGVIDSELVPGYGSLWMFNDLTWAQMSASLKEAIPLPPLGYGDSEFVDRWESADLDALRLFYLGDL